MADDSELAQADPQPPKPARRRLGIAFACGFLVLIALMIAQQLSFSRALLSSQLQMQDNAYQLRQMHVKLVAVEKSIAAQTEKWRGLEGQWASTTERLTKITDYTKEDWLIAESAYLTNLAASRLQTLQDVDTALQQLEMAQVRLQSFHDSGTLPLRESLAQNIQALEQSQKFDWESLWVQLGTISRALETLPLDAPGSPVINEDADASLDKGWRGNVKEAWGEIKSLVRVRHLDESSIIPLVTLQEQAQLINGLQFLVEEARWAVIQQNETIYQESLSLLKKRIGQYFIPEDSRVQNTLTTLSNLEAISFDINLPDLSPLVRQFQQVQNAMARGA